MVDEVGTTLWSKKIDNDEATILTALPSGPARSWRGTAVRSGLSFSQYGSPFGLDSSR